MITKHSSLFTGSVIPFFLILFMMSGTFKSSLELLGVNSVIDLTQLSLLSLVFLYSITSKGVQDKNSTTVLLIFFVFLVIYFASSLYTSSSDYYVTKMIFSVGVVFSFLFGLYATVLIKAQFFKYYPIAVIFLTLSYFVNIFVGFDPDKLREYIGNSLVIGEFIGLLMIQLYFSKVNFRLTYLVLLTIFLIVLGARGPLLFATLIILSLSAFRFHRFKFRVKTRNLVLLSIMFVSIVSLIPDEYYEKFSITFVDGFSRFELLFSEDKGASINSREQMLSVTVDKIDQNIIFGHGLGSFGNEIYNSDYRAYPHNVPLEIWFEAGILPFLMFHLLIFIISMLLIKRKNLFFLSMIAYLYLNILKSSSFEELRLFFFVLGISVCNTSAWYINKGKIDTGARRYLNNKAKLNS